MKRLLAWHRLGLSLGLVALFALLASPVWAGPDPSPEVLAAEALLDQGRIDEAARAYRAAVKKAPRDAAVRERALVLRRVASIRRFVVTKHDAPQWLTSAVALHAFYLSEDLGTQALALAKDAYARHPSARTAVMVAESHLALGQAQEAAVLLAGRPMATAQERLLNGIALARLGQQDATKAPEYREAAQGLASGVTLGADAHPGLLLDMARLESLLGAQDKALALLKRSFEATPPAALLAARARAEGSSDFAWMRQTPAFQKVLLTPSKVKSTCSGGTSCATCPNRGGCGKK